MMTKFVRQRVILLGVTWPEGRNALWLLITANWSIENNESSLKFLTQKILIARILKEMFNEDLFIYS